MERLLRILFREAAYAVFFFFCGAMAGFSAHLAVTPDCPVNQKMGAQEKEPSP